MMVRRRWFVAVVVLASFLLVACGGAAPAASPQAGGDSNSLAEVSSGGRVKESASLGTSAIPPAPGAEGEPASRGAVGPTAEVAGVCLNSEEAELARQINEYRASLNLPPMQVSKSLSLVAQQHVWDSSTNQASMPVPPPGKSCNLHSWTRVVNPALTQGTWTEVCYTSDHANAAGMWNKPREIAGYPADGVENSFATSGTATATGALTAWKNSPGHNNVITQQGGWGPMAAMGVGVGNGFAHLWMSSAADPAGVAQLCPGVTLPQPTAIPPTAVPPTAVPPTVAPTAVPPTVPPTEVPPTAVPPTTAPDATAVPPTVAPPPTEVPPTAVPPTAVPPTAVPPTTAAPTGSVIKETGTVNAGGSNVHAFPLVAGRNYTLLVTPSAAFDVLPRFDCDIAGMGAVGFDFDWHWEGEVETFSFAAPGNSNSDCRLTISGYQGSTGTYTVEVVAQ